MSKIKIIILVNFLLGLVSLAQGVQQPYEVSVVTSIEQANTINIDFTAYPNPATENLKLKIGNYKTDNLIYQLFDVSGKLIENKKIESTETIINMEKLDHASYFVKIIDNKKEVKVLRSLSPLQVLFHLQINKKLIC